MTPNRPARLRSPGIGGPDDDPAVLMEPTGPDLRPWRQLVTAAKRVMNRVRRNVRASGAGAGTDRLTGLGASVLVRSRAP
ncbi:hypothetical protein AB0I54_28995 [Streptomyces sp. NPDC050625]|uniref:hypothetical protein n=1 Tax=Streptomyces sp. NPDC050625 TaxID=3154629 RepID=UPI003434BFAE